MNFISCTRDESWAGVPPHCETVMISRSRCFILNACEEAQPKPNIKIKPTTKTFILFIHFNSKGVRNEFASLCGFSQKCSEARFDVLLLAPSGFICSSHERMREPSRRGGMDGGMHASARGLRYFAPSGRAAIFFVIKKMLRGEVRRATFRPERFYLFVPRKNAGTVPPRRDGRWHARFSCP